MSPAFQTHLTVLKRSASRYASSPAFKIPRWDLITGDLRDWQTITYAQFQKDVEIVAGHWYRIFGAQQLPQQSTIGLWLGGMTYGDVLHIYGVSRAGYIPQLFSLRLPSPIVVSELLDKANACALICDPSFASLSAETSVSVHIAVGIDKMGEGSFPLPCLPQIYEGDDIAFVFHTSGSTSGSPKLVPCSYTWLDTAASKARQLSAPKSLERQDVTAWLGSMCHIGQSFMLLGSLQHGSCTVQPPRIDFSPDELVDMIHRCALNRLLQFASFLANTLRSAKGDPKLLTLLHDLDQVTYSGAALPRDEEVWAYRNGIKLKNLFGSTESGAMMLSVGDSGPFAPLLRPLDGVSYGFFPVASQFQPGLKQGSTLSIVELVILAESGDCPHPSLRHADGQFHTGDLFQEVHPGLYISRGRDDDWIKSANGLRCDTKAIEDEVRAACGSLIEDCVVVGNGRPSPLLFIEPSTNLDAEQFKTDIINKTEPFHSRRYLHESISSTKMIIIVPAKSLPRTATKGNIRRRAVEEAYRARIDAIFS